MAAVLVNGCGEICSGACEVCGATCGALCRLPCKACDVVCDGCTNVCESCCMAFSNICMSPFGVFVTVATIFNLPAIYIGLTSTLSNGLLCHGTRWLFINAMFAVVNVIAAFYMSTIVVSSDQPEITDEEGNGVTATATSSNKKQKKPTTAFGRAGHLLCYDPYMAIYILILLGFFVWLWTGGIWSLNGTNYTNCSEDSGVQGQVAIALGFGWAFFFFGFSALCLGVCCAYCYDDTSDNNNNSLSYSLYHEQYFVGDPNNNGKPNHNVATATNNVSPSNVVQAQQTQREEIPTAQAILY